MIVLGIRAKPTEVTFAVIDSARNEVMNVEVIKIPKALDVPDSLKYVRNSVLDVLREFSVQKAGVRIVEPNAQRIHTRRLEIEGVIQESFASSALEGFYCGQISSISKRIGIPRASFKPMVEGDQVFEGVANWSQMSKEAREAIFVALGAIHA